MSETATLIIHAMNLLGGETSMRSHLDDAESLLAGVVDVDLNIEDMTAEQQDMAAKALTNVAGLFKATAQGFRKASKANCY